MKKVRFFIPAIVVLLDQLIKHFVRKAPVGYELGCIEGCIRFVHSRNTGAAFSILSGKNTYLSAFSILLMILILYFIFVKLNLTIHAHTAFLFLIGGGIGNLIDRIAFSGVTDYIQLLFISFPVFNLADIAVTLSVLYMVYLIMLGKFEKDV